MKARREDGRVVDDEKVALGELRDDVREPGVAPYARVAIDYEESARVATRRWHLRDPLARKIVVDRPYLRMKRFSRIVRMIERMIEVASGM
jgi:hypothetical protein